MTKKIRVSILNTGAYIEVLSRISIREAGIRGAYAYLTGSDAGNFKVVNSTWIGGSTQPDAIAALLRRGVQSLGISIASIYGYHLEASLGVASAYTGVMRMNASSGMKPTTEAAASFANAWVTQVWAIAVDQYVVRLAPIGSSGDSLVTCINKALFEAIGQFCRSTGLRFTKCLPGLTNVLSSTPWVQRSATCEITQDNVQVEVQTEHGDPAALNIVQFVLLINARPVTVLRFWPNALNPDDFDAIARRITAQHGFSGIPSVRVWQWPAVVRSAPA